MAGQESAGEVGPELPLPALSAQLPQHPGLPPLCHDCFLGRGGGLALEPLRGSPWEGEAVAGCT